MIIMRVGIRGIGRAAFAALGIHLIAACGPGASASEVANLRAEVEKLKQKLRAQDGERPPPGQEAIFLKAREALFDKRIAGERQDDAATKESQRLLQLALTAADKETGAGPNKNQGTLDIKCYGTLCRAQTTHASVKAYEAFLRAAFSGIPGEKDAPDRPRLYPGWYSVTEANTTGGKVAAVFYVGQVNKAKATPLRTTVPQ